MNREAPNKSMGFFGIYKEACKLTAANKKIFSQITLNLLLPLAFFLLSEIFISTYLFTESTPRWIDYGWNAAQILYFKFMPIFSVWSASSIVYTVACFYTSRDITYKKVTGVFWRLRWDLTLTFLCCLIIVVIYSSVTFGLLLYWFFADGIRALKFIICLSIPAFAGLTYMMVVWNIATVVGVLENDCYGRKALARSMRLIKGKIWVSCAVFGLLEIAFVGILFTYCYLSIYGGNEMSMVGRVSVGIGCHFLMAIWFHILIVVHSVVYFVCKSVHNEDISTVATHLEDVQLKDVQLEQVQVPV